MSDVKTESANLSFGDALEELEQIVGQLESGQLELEESLDNYQRGVELLKSLQGKLADAQQKVTMLIGELEEEAAATEPSPGTDASSPSSEEVPF